jgi:hypothetical protein
MKTAIKSMAFAIIAGTSSMALAQQAPQGSYMSQGQGGAQQAVPQGPAVAPGYAYPGYYGAPAYGPYSYGPYAGPGYWGGPGYGPGYWGGPYYGPGYWGGPWNGYGTGTGRMSFSMDGGGWGRGYGW